MRTGSSAHAPPRKRSITPPACTSAVSPAGALGGGWARTTVAWANGTRSRTISAARTASASRVAMHRRPHATGGGGHLDVPHAVRLQRVYDRVDDRRGRADGRGLADPLGADRVVRGRGDRVPRLPVRHLHRRGDQIIHEGPAEAVPVLVEVD